MWISSLNKLASWNDTILHRSVLHYPWQYNFIWCFFVNINILSQKYENWRVLLQVRQEVIYLRHPQGRGSGVTGFSPIFWMILDGFERGWFDRSGRQYVNEANLFLSMLSKDILNFFDFQLLHCFLETCLICSPTLRIQEVRYNFMRSDSSSVCLFSYHQCFYT